MLILAIDTSCDDTSCAVLRDTKVLSNVISSQVEAHAAWGGVVPSIARREHELLIQPVVEKALQMAKVSMKEIDAIAVTYGPGLAIALGVGIDKAQELARTYKKQLIGVNHMEGHLLSVLANSQLANSQSCTLQFPSLGLLVSGNHTELVLIHAIGSYQILGQTLDDAIGEAFDKVARALGLGYPGGAVLAKLAEQGNSQAYNLPIPMRGVKSFDFSYSGLKAAVMRVMKEKADTGLNQQDVADIAASFQRVAIQHVLDKTTRALETHFPHSLLLGGGVAANILLRKELRKLCKKHGVHLLIPSSKKFCMDNAAMIGVVAYFKAQRNEFAKSEHDVDRQPNAIIA